MNIKELLGILITKINQLIIAVNNIEVYVGVKESEDVNSLTYRIEQLEKCCEELRNGASNIDYLLMLLTVKMSDSRFVFNTEVCLDCIINGDREYFVYEGARIFPIDLSLYPFVFDLDVDLDKLIVGNREWYVEDGVRRYLVDFGRYGYVGKEIEDIDHLIYGDRDYILEGNKRIILPDMDIGLVFRDVDLDKIINREYVLDNQRRIMLPDSRRYGYVSKDVEDIDRIVNGVNWVVDELGKRWLYNGLEYYGIKPLNVKLDKLLNSDWGYIVEDSKRILIPKFEDYRYKLEDVNLDRKLNGEYPYLLDGNVRVLLPNFEDYRYVMKDTDLDYTLVHDYWILEGNRRLLTVIPERYTVKLNEDVKLDLIMNVQGE